MSLCAAIPNEVSDSMPIRLSTVSGLWASVVLILLNTAALLVSLQWSRVDNAAVHHTRDVQISLSNMWDRLQNAETGQRGFLLTGTVSNLDLAARIFGRK